MVVLPDKNRDGRTDHSELHYWSSYLFTITRKPLQRSKSRPRIWRLDSWYFNLESSSVYGFGKGFPTAIRQASKMRYDNIAQLPGRPTEDIHRLRIEFAIN